MRKKWMTFVLIAGVLLLGYSARIYGTSNDIKRSELEAPENPQNMLSIADKVITATGRSERFTPNDVEQVQVYYADVYGDDKEEAVIAVHLAPKDTIVAVYTPEGDSYKYVGDVGAFFDVRKVEFVPIGQTGNNMIFITEFADQRIGAYEKNEFIRGYLWKDDAFQLVLNVPAQIQATWNRLWEQGEFEGDSQWERITQLTNFNWEGGKSPILNMQQNQVFSLSNDTQARNIPADETFTPVQERTVAQKLYWNDEWRSFIMYEMMDKATGQRVAVLEDFSLSPYVLTGENLTQYRILRKDGTIEIVQRDSLSEIRSQTEQPVFIVD